MSFDPRDPIFEKLLDLNPWARELWDERLDLIAAESWNISYRNQGGNPDTMAWLRRFLPARSDATLDRLGSGDHSAWHRGIFEAIVPLFDDPTFATAYIGTPMKPTQGGALINTDTRVAGYSVGQFKADVLLLAQASLYEVSLDTPLDLSRLSFVIGPYIYASRFAAIAAHETRLVLLAISYPAGSDCLTRLALSSLIRSGSRPVHSRVTRFLPAQSFTVVPLSKAYHSTVRRILQRLCLVTGPPLQAPSLRRWQCSVMPVSKVTPLLSTSPSRPRQISPAPVLRPVSACQGSRIALLSE